MNTVDDLLKTIVNHDPEQLNTKLTSRDLKTLRNLARLVDDPRYITENQSKLVLRLLADTATTLDTFVVETTQIMKSPSWARPFRIIHNVRKIYINNSQEFQRITIEATFSSDLRNKISQLNKNTTGFIQELHGRLFSADLTEKNIVTIIDQLRPFGFEVSEDLKNYYDIIKSWSEHDVKNQYRIDTMSYPNFEKQIINDLGIDTAIDQFIINDRSIRYQYFVENAEKSSKELAEMLAHRKQTKVWVDKNQFTLDELVEAFIKLRRMPTLIVFDSNDSKKCLEKLKKISDSLEKNGIFDGVGIYFRLDNDSVGKEFNQIIADRQYNCHLNSDTKVVGVQSGKIPKFLLKSDWKPMSVVSLDTVLRHSKTAVYANCCDLVVTYSEQQPVIDARVIWE